MKSCGGQFTPPLFQRSMKTRQHGRLQVARSDVRLQFDPDHNPSGAPVERRAIQLGLRGEILAKYAREWLLGIEDVSEFVREQSQHARSPYDRLVTPREEVYPVNDPRLPHGWAWQLGDHDPFVGQDSMAWLRTAPPYG